MIPTDDTTPRPSRPPAIPAAGTVATGLDHNPGRVPDPGSGRARAVALVVLVVFFGVTFILQQLASSGPERPSNESAVITPPGNDPDVWVAKLAVKFSNLGMFKDQGSPAPGAAMMPQIDAAARTPIDRFRAAIIAAEVIGAEEGLARLDRLAESLGQGPLASIESPTEPGPDQAEVDTPLPPTLAADMATLEAVYRGTADSLTVEQQDGLVARHGWFGRLALTHGLDNADPRRDPLVSGGGTLLAVSIVLGAGFFLLLVAGLVLCIVVIVRIISGKMTRRFTPPAIGGSVYLETAAVFVVAFVVFKVMLGLLGSAIGTATGPMGAVVLSAQWVLLLAALWPLVRGVGFTSMRRAMGWRADRGVWREVWAGVVGYIAGIPVLVGAVVTALVMVLLWSAIRQALGGDPSPPPTNPVIDVIAGADPWVLVAFVVLATLWAPIVEETIFRGCLYRHMRSRTGPIIAGVLSAAVFGGMHGYAGPLLLPVTALGFVFAMMREWRGSLIAPVTAHLIHNAAVATILVTFVTLLRD